MMSHYIYGIHAVTTLLSSHPEMLEHLYVQQGRDKKRLQHCLDQAKASGIVVSVLPGDELDQLANQNKNHQGIVALCKTLPSYTEADLTNLLQKQTSPYLLLVLDGVSDPHNLGACMRVANAMGVNFIITPKDRSVGITPVVHKVASGAALLTPLVRVTNLARTLRWLKEEGVWIVGTDEATEETISQIDLKGSIAIVMGSEGSGLRALTRKHCDFLARVDLCGVVRSLNVAVATGICLYECYRQRHE